MRANDLRDNLVQWLRPRSSSPQVHRYTWSEETYRSSVQLPNTYGIIMRFVPILGTKSSHFRSEIRLSEGVTVSLALSRRPSLETEDEKRAASYIYR